MKRCLKMLINSNNWQTLWSDQIQLKAKELEIEGLMQATSDSQLRIMVCGQDAKLDDFMDYLYDFLPTINASLNDLEPFIKDREFRGIFRVIE